MISDRTEHFCTLFDSGFLPLGLALHESLLRQMPHAWLWVLCMDREVEESLNRLALPRLTPISLAEVETPDLLGVRPGRSRAEYCWTLTPFVPDAVFQRAPHAERVTYVDADLFFFNSPGLLIDELDAAGKDVLITEHGYAPEYDQSAISGRFCVQFLTYRHTQATRTILRWWQERCLEWCFATPDGDRFGDQKYLEQWPKLFGDDVHVSTRTDRMLAPWNAAAFEERKGRIDPVFYHFHGLRLFQGGWVRWIADYRVGPQAKHLYDVYLDALGRAVGMISRSGIPLKADPLLPSQPKSWLRLVRQVVLHGARFKLLPGPLAPAGGRVEVRDAAG